MPAPAVLRSWRTPGRPDRLRSPDHGEAEFRLLRAYTLVMIVPASLVLEGARTEGVTGLMVAAFTLFVWSTGKVHHQRFISWLCYNQLLDLRTKQLQESRRQGAEMLEQETAQRQLLSEQNVALEKARQDADVANQSKSAFLDSMSHEIRTPMNAIVTLSDLLHETTLSEQQQEWVETIKQGCGSLLSLISDVLDMAKIEAGRVELSQSRFSPPNFARNSCACSRPTPPKKAFEEDRKRCLAAGMNDFLIKPLRRDALLESLERVQLEAI